MMGNPEIGDDDLPPRRPDLHAVVEVIPPVRPEGLVEADVVDRPRRQRQHEPIDDVHLYSVRGARLVADAGGSGRKFAAAELRIPVDEGAHDLRVVPPRDAVGIDRPDAAHHAHVGIRQGSPELPAEIGVDNLSVLVHQDQRLEVLARRDLLEQQVVAAKDGARGLERKHR